jgi:hypothetical protein
MTDETVVDSGRLLPSYLPAVYFDSSVLIDYWVTEGAEITYPPELTVRDHSYVAVLRELLKSDRRYAGMIAVRKAVLGERLNATAVTSPLALLELIEWQAEAVFKNLAAEAAGTLAIQKKSKKDLGDLLRKVLELRRQEAADATADRSQGRPASRFWQQRRGLTRASHVFMASAEWSMPTCGNST